MFWLTLRQEVCWCDDFMAWCLSFGDLNCGIALGQRKIKCCLVFFKFLLSVVFPALWTQGHHY